MYFIVILRAYYATKACIERFRKFIAVTNTFNSGKKNFLPNFFFSAMMVIKKALVE